METLLGTAKLNDLNPAQWLYAVDGSTIRLCTEDGYEGDDEIFALQVDVSGFDHLRGLWHFAG